ncbi:MAG: Abi-alpha family protein [Nocardioides sp.]|uniref:Abi-alpha family protein n=1 Tax=Nocardioides sp. TaxID=35761 RepID=UPI0039E69E36
MTDLVPRRSRLAGLGAVPGLARVAAGVSVNTVGWGARAAWRGGSRVVRAAVDPAEAAELVREVLRAAEVVRETALGDTARGSGAPLAPVKQAVTPTSLRERGADLLERSRDVWSPDEGHPAFDRILGDLAPDEARILLLLLRGGPQPSVDVRTGGPVGVVSSQLIAPGLSMIGMRAGVRYAGHVPAYLDNLHRLGLVWFSKESIADSEEYQVLEAQPDVLGALHSVRFARVVRRSIHLTPFGEEFCRACLVSEEQAVTEAFPEHADPEAD